MVVIFQSKMKKNCIENSFFSVGILVSLNLSKGQHKTFKLIAEKRVTIWVGSDNL